MEKEYPKPEEKSEENIAQEPAPQYGTDYGMVADEQLEEEVEQSREQPPLTQEEIDNALTGEEFKRRWKEHIDKTFDK